MTVINVLPIEFFNSSGRVIFIFLSWGIRHRFFVGNFKNWKTDVCVSVFLWVYICKSERNECMLKNGICEDCLMCKKCVDVFVCGSVCLRTPGCKYIIALVKEISICECVNQREKK